MQISKEKFDDLNAKIDILEKQVDYERSRCVYMEQIVVPFERILDKIIRAAEGLPLIQPHNQNEYGMSPNFSSYEPPHRCAPFTPEELKQGELEGLREQAMMFAERLAAVKAIATFAKEHKA